MNKKKTISFIGSGNVASYLAKAFHAKGYSIRQIYSSQIKNAEKLAIQVKAVACPSLKKFDTNVSFIIIAINDSQIMNVLPEINKSAKAIFVHTAGSVNVDVFNVHHKNFGVLYPLQTFTKEAEIVHKNFPYFIEGNSSINTKHIIELAKSISLNVHHATSEQRKTLHLAGVYTNNFINHLLSISKDIVEKEQLKFNYLLPLISETISKTQVQSPNECQTGPAKRNDQNTIQSHRELLKNYPPNFSFIYEAITKSIIDKYHSND